MVTPNRQAEEIIARILGDQTPQQKGELLRPRDPRREPLPPSVPAGSDLTPRGVAARRRMLQELGISSDQLAGEGPEIPPEQLSGNIESFIGYARIPVGVIGPLRINGLEAHGDFYVPLATSEGALVASCNRGAHLISHAGGATVMCLAESVSRAPCFVFDCMAAAAHFLATMLPRFDTFQEIVARTSRHCRLIDLQTCLNGKETYLIFKFTTGDAAGQNMVTFATEAICKELLRLTPVQPERWYLEGNMSGDKKATMLSFISTRGRSVVAEAIIPHDLCSRYLHAEPGAMADYWQVSTVGGIQSGSIGVQGHAANPLTAMFIACGQDVACVSEAAVGMTRLDVTAAGDLYASVKLPNVIVGTVGGGTHLPTARESLAMLGCEGDGSARKFAEICAATVLAGEISIIGSLAAGDFGQAHARYGRKAK